MHMRQILASGRLYSPLPAHLSLRPSFIAARDRLKVSAASGAALGLRSRSQVFFGACAVVFVVFVFSYTYLGAPHWIHIDSDTPSYVQPLLWGSYSDGRNPGFPAFLRVMHAVVGLGRLGEVQLALQLLGFAIAVAMLARAYQAWVSSGIVLILSCYIGVFSYFSSQVLTESLYLFGLSLFAFGLAAAVRRPALGLFVLTGIGLAAAVLAKSIGIVFLAPSLLGVRFLPKQVRGKAVALIMLPAVSIYMIMCVHGYTRFGEFRPETMSGVQLTGIAASFLQPSSSNDKLAIALQEAAKPLLDKRPADLTQIHSIDNLNRYVDYTAREFNQILWFAFYPAALEYTNNAPFHVINAKLHKIGLRSIRARPDLYALHVLTNFYGIWRQIGRVCRWGDERDNCDVRWSPDLISMSKTIRGQHQAFQWPDIIKFTDTNAHILGIPQPSSSKEVSDALAVQEEIPTMGVRPLDELVDGFSTLTIAIGVVALVASLLFLLPLRYISALAPSIVLSLILNAHVAGHALFGGYADLRYAAVLIPILVGFLFCIVKDIGQTAFFQRHVSALLNRKGVRLA
jgi:hypothetical protein